jgi:hypothetical protein
MSVEAVLVFPLLLWAYAAMFVYWDAFKTQNINLKAAYTVADLITRSGGEPIFPDYVDGTNAIYNFLIRKDEGNDLRVSAIQMRTDPSTPTAPPSHDLEWSYGTGLIQARTDLTGLENRLPDLAAGAQMIIVEATMTWSPPINFTLEPLGLSTMEFQNMVFAIPRANDVGWDGDGDGEADPPLWEASGG